MERFLAILLLIGIVLVACVFMGWTAEYPCPNPLDDEHEVQK